MKSVLGAAAVLTCATCAAEQRADFAYSAPISLEQGAPVNQATLTADTYRRAAFSDLRDLRVFNGNDEVVPFSLREAPRTSGTRKPLVPVPIFPLRGDETKALEALRVTITSDHRSINVATPAVTSRSEPALGYLVDLRKQDDPIVAVEFSWAETARDFSTTATLAVSDDMSTWRAIGVAASIVSLQFAGQRLQQRRIEFPAVRAKFLRVGLAGASSVSLDGISVEPMAANAETARVHTESVGVSTEAGKEYEFDLGLQAPIDRLTIRLPQENSAVQATVLSRPTLQAPWHVVGAATFYRIHRDDRDIENQDIRIAPDTDRYWKLSIENRNGLGAGAPRLRVEWVPAQLMFVARGTPPFNVSIGNNLAGRAETSLDAFVTRRSSDADSREIVPVAARIGDFVEVGGIAKLAQSPPADLKNWALWSVLVLAVFALAFMARRLLREMSDKR